MKQFMFTLLFISLGMFILLFPTTETVVVDKHDITENRVFAGVLNGTTVGSSLCVRYWLNYDEMPDIVRYEVQRPVVLGYLLGEVYSVKATVIQ